MRVKYIIGCLLLIILSFIDYSCKEGPKNQAKRISEKKVDSCFSTSEKKELINAVFGSSYIKDNHMDPSVAKGQKSLRLLESEFLSRDLTGSFLSKKFEIVDSASVTNEDYRVEVIEKNCKAKSLVVEITCPYEGHWYMRVIAVYNPEDKKWFTEVLSGGIAD